MGHEASGVITQLGKNTGAWKEGDRVTFDSTIYCGECDFCRKGQINLCERRRVLGVSCEDYRQDGAFAEFVRVPARVLYRLPSELPFEHGALVEPFSIAMHAVRRASVKPGQTAAVIGAGMIGLAIIQLLRHAGCAKIIVADITRERLDLALKLGATDIINSSNNNAAGIISEMTAGHGVDVSFEAVGITVTVDLAVRCLAKGGSTVLVGNISPNVQFPLQLAVTRELTIYGSCASRGEYPDCLDLLAKGVLRADPLISASRPLSEGSDWFDRLYRRDASLMKVILKP
jgi:L-iditol 2-dehydrogenase